jgi:hypothetical protein
VLDMPMATEAAREGFAVTTAPEGTARFRRDADRRDRAAV